MIPLAEAPPSVLARLSGLLFDLDDTVLSHGRLTLPAYEALFRLKEAGLDLVAVTGRPSGWGELIARQWPVDAVVTENGAVAIVREGEGLRRIERCDEAERRGRRVRLASVIERVSEAVPEARLTDDTAARVSDVAWDIGERLKLPEDRISELSAAIVLAGARTSRSSVHVHATFDTDDKASGVLRLLHERFGVDEGAALARYAFVGDSANDGPCFAAFRTTFGVANVRPFLARLSRPPVFVAEGAMGGGFAEIAGAIVRARASARHVSGEIAAT